MSNPIFVSFYTQDQYYSSFAKKLMNKIDELNSKSEIKFNYDFKVYDKKPTDTWSSITFKKPEYIRKWLDQYESIIWIDIDSTMHRLPSLSTDKVINCPYDLAAIDRGNDGTVYDYLWFVRSTPVTKKFFEDVTERIKKYYMNNSDHHIKEGGDHDAVLKTLNEYKIKYPNLYGSIGVGNFGFSTGWTTFGISGNEPGGKKRTVNRVQNSNRLTAKPNRNLFVGGIINQQMRKGKNK